MKKLAILAILGIAVSANATAIKWAIGSFLYGVDKDGTASQAYTVADGFTDEFKTGSPSFVLVYLGVNETAKTASDVKNALKDEESNVAIVQTIAASSIINQSTSTSKAGKANSAQTYSAPDVAGSTYQVFFSYDGVLKDIYTDADLTTAAQVVVKVSQDAVTEVYSAAPSPLYAAGSGSTVSYVSVPEPATASLVLAGLALLLKRRRA